MLQVTLTHVLLKPPVPPKGVSIPTIYTLPPYNSSLFPSKQSYFIPYHKILYQFWYCMPLFSQRGLKE